jgi:hypothetical protein
MINGVSESAASYAAQALIGTQAAGGTPAAGGSTSATPVLSSVANLLGMSTDDLTTSLKSGSSMSDLASQKGVSRADLLAAITQGLQSDQSAAATSQAGGTSALAGQIADHKGVPGHHHHHHGGGSSSTSTELQQKVSDLSSALGISNDELVKALQTGLAGTPSASAGSGAGYGVSASLLQGLQVDQLA